MKTVVFDFDGTLTKKTHEIWSKMWEILDAKDVDEKLYNQYKNKEIDYIKWCELIEKEFIKRNFNLEKLKEVSKGIELMDNLDVTLKTLKDNGYHLYIISGGVDKVIYEKLGKVKNYFEEIWANVFDFDRDGKLVKIHPTRYDDDGKKTFIDEYCKKTGTKASEITFVGNGDNDEYVYLSGCKTICINPTSKTNHTNKEIWHYVIENVSDMKAILGYFEYKFDHDEYVRLVSEDIYKAREYCSVYPDDLSAIGQLIVLDLLYFHKEKPRKAIKDLNNIIKRIDDTDRKAYFKWSIIQYYYYNEDYKKVIKYGDKIKEMNFSTTIYFYYYLSKVKLNNDMNSLDKLKEFIIINNYLDEEFICTICEYYYKNQLEKEVDEFFNSLFLISNDLEKLFRLQFQLICRYSEAEDLIEEKFNDWKKSTKNKEKVIVEFYDLVYPLIDKKPLLTIKLLDKLGNNKNSGLDGDYYHLIMGLCYANLSIEDCKKSCEEFTKIKQEYIIYSSPYHLYNMAKVIYFDCNRSMYKRAVELLNFAYLNYSDIQSLRLLIDILISMGDYNEVWKVAQKLEKVGVLASEAKAICYGSQGKFDEAYKEIKKVDFSCHYNSYVKEYDKVSQKIFATYLLGESPEDYRQKALMYFHGFGVDKVDINKALEYALKAKELDPSWNCANSVLGNIYLSLKEYDKAFALFEEGYNNYINYKDDCPCCVGFYCYCLMFGYGTQKDEDKAYEILDNFDFNVASDVIFYDYAYLCLLKNTNLERAYTLLLNHYEWRYDEGKYFLLIQLAKRLGKDYSEFEKKFNDNLPHLPIREREHYQKEKEIFYLTNI